MCQLYTWNGINVLCTLYESIILFVFCGVHDDTREAYSRRAFSVNKARDYDVLPVHSASSKCHFGVMELSRFNTKPAEL